MSKVEVGQKLWWVPARQRALPEYVEVVKVGRKWATLDNRERCDVVTLAVDGGDYSPAGRLYLSQADADAETALRRRWGNLSQQVSQRYGNVPEGLTVADIDAALVLLKLEPARPGDGKGGVE